MKILLASPVYSSPWFGSWFDCGAFLMKALHQLGHSVAVWDYRLETRPPVGTYDLAIVWKGNKHVHDTLPRPKVCYWPDMFGRDTENEQGLESYNKVFVPLRPTPEGMIWLPTGWDPDYHKNLGLERIPQMVFVGTKSERKLRYLSVIQPAALFGNGWGSSWRAAELVQPQPAVYLQDYVSLLNQYQLTLNVHRDNIGINSRVFEFCACAPCVMDNVPGVREIFGDSVASRAIFDTPEEGRALTHYLLGAPKVLEEIWTAQRECIKPFTYKAAVERMLSSMGLFNKRRATLESMEEVNSSH